MIDRVYPREEMFERFTERARQVVVLAQDEARALKHNYIGTEHILLGLLREEEGLAARVLESLDVTIEGARAEVARIIGPGDEAIPGQIPFTPRTKKVLELALREALLLGHNYIGTEHILLGLVRENEGVAARILADFGAGPQRVAEAVVARISAEPPAEYAERFARLGPMSEPHSFVQSVLQPADHPSLAAGRGLSLRGAIVLGWALFGIAAAIGLFIGWLIWG
jgi:ATP-dependent Clp protease ATP-binding subunit ClpA